MQNSIKEVSMAAEERRVFDAVAAGKRKFQDIGATLSSIGRGDAASDSRKLDRILQRLRKRGLIEFRNGIGWCVEGSS